MLVRSRIYASVVTAASKTEVYIDSNAKPLSKNRSNK